MPRSRKQMDARGTQTGAMPPSQRVEPDQRIEPALPEPAFIGDPDPEEVRLRAYERYVSRHGNGGGDPEQDWIEAEAELRRECHLRAIARQNPDIENGRAPDGA